MTWRSVFLWLVGSSVNVFITDEVGGACAQVLSTDGDFSPGCALVGRDACDQGGRAGTRHGGQTAATAKQRRSAPVCGKRWGEHSEISEGQTQT